MFKDNVLNSFLQTNTLSALTETVSLLLKCPVIIVDETFHIAASFAADGCDYEEYRIAVSHSELSFAAAAAISERAQSAADGAFCFEKSNKKYRVFILENVKTMIGYMICIFELSDLPPCTDEELTLAAALISKQLCLEKRQTASNSAEEVLTSLLNGEFSDREHFLLQAQSTYLSNFHPESFALIDLGNYAASKSADDFLRKTLESDFHGSHPFVYKERIIMFIYNDHDLTRLEQTAKSEDLGIVLSPQLKDLYSLRTVYDTVTFAMDFLLLRGAKGFLEKAEHYSLLAALKSAANNGGFTIPEVERLSEYDRKGSSELCKTLYAYLICHHSLKETCEMLYTHRNTVLYRIRKIKEDFGIDLEAPEKHFKYLLAAALILVKNGEEDIFIDDGLSHF